MARLWILEDHGLFTAESTRAATTFIHRHSSLNRRALSHRVEIFRGRCGQGVGAAAIERFG
jgi:hypothetical protein